MKSLLTLLIIITSFATSNGQGKDSTFLNKEFVKSVAWTRTSGEYRALSFQAYNFATLSLDKALSEKKDKRPKCVVVDIDETVLDNSEYYEVAIKEKKPLNWENWKNWLLTQSADTVPGAATFLRYAASKNVEVFYLTNREIDFNESTLINFKKFNLPNADTAHYLPMITTYNKEGRRAEIAKNYNILLFAGDNLSDFTSFFYKNGENINEKVDEHQKLFGTKFIVLPNSIYGSWAR
ncbi:5'-nucleotidase, lipoprotein e(P4) family [Pedobacter changchengzhani]|uniref:5'-nucleotidase, lipoprotein e(P4) family n=1 Tax=Pedobacter changchengzhani TaxID=2529274 RepID=A0A4R5MH55_9SPHI|nr:5'-nucleotidase, lipoprotein e(P4) family [Pedobacter changchengzhani]TDG34857.1 5'-nucleotidase, lipoprotein e(P4) family [Pedobacter changchengzhani]